MDDQKKSYEESEDEIDNLIEDNIWIFTEKYFKKGLSPDEIIILAKENEYTEEDIKAIPEFYKSAYDFYLMDIPTIQSYLLAILGGFIGAVFYAIISANIIGFLSEYFILILVFSGLFIAKTIKFFIGDKTSNIFFIFGCLYNLFFFIFFKYILFFIHSITHIISNDFSYLPIYSKKLFDLFINMKYYIPNENSVIILFLLSFIGLYIVLPIEKPVKLNNNYKNNSR